MIFVLGKDQPALFCMLTEEDVLTMRKGLTKFVDHHQLGTAHFTSCILSLHKNHDEIKKMLAGLGHAGAMVNPAPTSEEVKCAGCQGIMKFESLFEGKCIVCWATQAKGAGITINPV